MDLEYGNGGSTTVLLLLQGQTNGRAILKALLQRNYVGTGDRILATSVSPRHFGGTSCLVCPCAGLCLLRLRPVFLLHIESNILPAFIAIAGKKQITETYCFLTSRLG